MGGDKLLLDMAKGTKAKKRVGVSAHNLKAYAPIIDLLSKEKKRPQINRCLLSILPEDGIDVVCECLFNAIHSKLLGKEQLKELSSVQDQDVIRYLASGRGGVKKRRNIIVSKSEDISKTLSSIIPLLKRVVAGK